MPTVSTFTSVINQFLPEPHAGLLAGILFGVKASLDPALKQALITTGTLHIIALSGMNITILTNLVMLSLLWVVPRKIAVVLALFGITGFIFFVGPSASVMRAALMGGISLVGILFGKNVWALWSWGVAVVLMLVVRPVWITDLSFQLSALASLGMILFGDEKMTVNMHQPVAECNCTGGEIRNQSLFDWVKILAQSLGSLLRTDACTTISAQVFTIPLLFFTFGRLSLIAPVVNALVIWTLPIITVLGFFVAVGGYIFLPLGQICAWISWIFLEYILQIIMWTSKIPFAGIG